MRIDLAGFAREGTLGDHKALMRLVERADRQGYDGIWFNEFHFRGATNAYPSTLLLGAEILGRTERLRFGTSILVLALQHPLLLAEQIAQLDHQSGGRIDIGIGRGTTPDTFDTLGIPCEEIGTRFLEGLDIMLEAWKGKRFSHKGRHWQFNDVEVGPPVTQRPHPPLYVAGVSEETVDIAASRGLPLLLSLEPNEARQLPVLAAAMKRRRTPPHALRRSSLSRYVIPAATEAKARAKVEALLDRLNARRALWAAERGQPAPVPRSLTTMLQEHAIAGTPEQCVDQIRALSARTGAHSMRAMFSANGLIPLPEAEAAMALFAREALPALRETPRPSRRKSVDAPSLEATQ